MQISMCEEGRRLFAFVSEPRVGACCVLCGVLCVFLYFSHFRGQNRTVRKGLVWLVVGPVGSNRRCFELFWGANKHV